MKKICFLFCLLGFVLVCSCDFQKQSSKKNITIKPAEEEETSEDYWFEGITQINDSLERTDWRKLEFNRTDSLIQKFVTVKSQEFEGKLRTSGYTLNDFPQFLYVVKINQDSLPDIVYSGPSGGEPTVFRIYLNRTDSFQLAFEGFQYAKKLVIIEGLIKSFTLGNPGCCAELANYDSEVLVKHTGSEVAFQVIRQTGREYITEKPTSFLSRPLHFKLPDKLVHVRATSTEADDWDPTNEQLGNVIASYSGNVGGKILATQQDKIGRKWHFVELPHRNNQPDSSIFYFDKSYPAYIQGWLSGNDVIIN